MITKFSPKTCEELKYYVYRLVDPRNGQTFYVGKGKNNRVFAHANIALKNFDGENYEYENDDEESLKLKQIRSIIASGLDVIYIIQKYGLTEKEAMLLESVLIDTYSLSNLTNKVKGFGADDCPINAITLEKNHSVEEFKDSPNNPNYILIKIKDYWIEQRGGIYEAVRSDWKLNLNRAKKYPYVLAVVGGIVKEVYEVKNWQYACGKIGNKIEFDGVVAPKNVRDLFFNKRIPSRFRMKGMASPALYSK